MKKIWFRRKTYGFGWTPCSWEGWLTIIIWAFLFVTLVMKIDHESVKNFIYIFALTCPLILICYIKGEKPKWQWGCKKDNKDSEILK